MKLSRFGLLPMSLALCCAAEPGDFATTVHPIPVSRCLSCHTADSGQAGLSLATREGMLKGGITGPALVPGDSARSLMVKRILGEAGNRMPMDGKPLPAAEIELIKQWIDAGAVVNIR